MYSLFGGILIHVVVVYRDLFLFLVKPDGVLCLPVALFVLNDRNVDVVDSFEGTDTLVDTYDEVIADTQLAA